MRCLWLILLISGSSDLTPTTRVVSLDEAIATAQQNHPQLKQAHASTAVADARADEALAPLLPQVSGNAQYQRTTSNFVPRPGSLPPQFAALLTAHNSGSTYNYWNFGLNAQQLIFDFGATYFVWDAARADARAAQHSEHTTWLTVALNVRTAYFDAQAQKALLQVAEQTLANQERHVQQIAGFVRVGTRPEIDLAQVRTDRANAKVQLVNAENSYRTAKARLNLNMGLSGGPDYDVSQVPLPPVPDEDSPTQVLVDEARKARPEFASFEQQILANTTRQRAVEGNYGPSLGVSTGLTDAGATLTEMAWNWSAQAVLSWNLFQGGLTAAQDREAAANISNIRAQAEALGQQVYLEVEQARLAVRAAKESLTAASEAVENARERLRLAEGRYNTGVGNAIELGDAQLAFTSAAAQKVQAEYNLSTARAQLIKALGRL